ncbi:putative RING finger protein EEED8.16 [Toxocara canis]|uniref:Putative RING finger protein EEED8.16 n=1 Tax=Toxocara canis TaxID=6265 RepID=A0A0B2UPU3_TOXCA|nr:putative RING finger protein EEED8.16 [Toxocara canis]
MSEVTPIVIRLEVEKNAPFIKLEFSGDKEELLTRPSGSKAMSSKRRNKKAAPISRADDCGEALPPVAANATQNDTERPTPSQAQCIGRRKYAEVVVETFTEETIAKSTIRETDSEPPQGCSMQPTASGSSISSKSASEPPGSFFDVEKMSYFSGNPFVEKTTGILHFYKHNETGLAQSANCSMLCMLGVPSLITCRELLKFVSPSLQSISAMKIIRDMTPNQYMVILKFKSHEAAVSFYDECNDIRFNQIEPERCSLVFVERVESVSLLLK